MSKKIISILIFSLISCIIFTSNVYAGDTKTVDQIISSADEFLKTGEDGALSSVKMRETSNFIYNTLLVIAVAVAVIVGSILGIKFMIETVEEKAKIKEAMIAYIVGCFIVFGAFGIWRIVVEVGNAISGDSGYSGEATPQNDDGTHQSSSGRTHGGSGGSF